MSTFNVLLDTNIFINSKYDFDRASLFNLKKYCNDGIVSMFTNDIILREVRHHINVNVKLLASQAKNAIKKGELVNALTKPVFDKIETLLIDAPNQLLTAFDTYMKDAKILSNNDLSVVELFNDYFELNAPFEIRKEKKSEFPDAAIIMSIKKYISSEENASLHIVTDDNGWHTALEGVPNIFLYKNIKELLTEISKGEENLYNQIVSFVKENSTLYKNNVKNWLLDQEWEFAIDENEFGIECDEVYKIDINDITLISNSIEYIDNKEGYAVATISEIAKLKLYFSYIDHSRETYDKEEHVWYNTIYGDGIAEIKVPINISMNVMFSTEDEESFDLDSLDFKNLNITDIVTINYELEEREEIFCDSQFGVCPDCGQQITISNDGGNGFCINCAEKH